jgi:hypothetical protein
LVFEAEKLQIDFVYGHIECQEGQIVVLHPETLKYRVLSLSEALNDSRREVVFFIQLLRLHPTATLHARSADCIALEVSLND